MLFEWSALYAERWEWRSAAQGLGGPLCWCLVRTILASATVNAKYAMIARTILEARIAEVREALRRAMNVKPPPDWKATMKNSRPANVKKPSR